MMFKLANVAFEDYRYPFDVVKFEKKQFNQDKSKFPFQALPVLQLQDGRMIPQSKAIERYVAKQFGFLGDNDVDAAMIDSCCEFIIDIKNKYNAVKASVIGLASVPTTMPSNEADRNKLQTYMSFKTMDDCPEKTLADARAAAADAADAAVSGSSAPPKQNEHSTPTPAPAGHVSASNTNHQPPQAPTTPRMAPMGISVGANPPQSTTTACNNPAMQPMRAYFTECFPYLLSMLEKIIAANGGTYVVGKKISLADLHIYALLTSYFDPMVQSNVVDVMLNRMKNLKQLCDNVHSQPLMQKWLKERPVTNF